MKTAEMYVLAQVNGKIYYSKDADAIYSKEWGLVEKDNIVSRVQVKTTRYSETPNTYTVQLKSAGGTANKQVRPFDNTKSELLFVLTGNNKTYLIPTKDITAKNSISIGNKYTEYEVFSKTLDQYVLELEG